MPSDSGRFRVVMPTVSRGFGWDLRETLTLDSDRGRLEMSARNASCVEGRSRGGRDRARPNAWRGTSVRSSRVACESRRVAGQRDAASCPPEHLCNLPSVVMTARRCESSHHEFVAWSPIGIGWSRTSQAWSCTEMSCAGARPLAVNRLRSEVFADPKCLTKRSLPAPVQRAATRESDESRSFKTRPRIGAM
jgi:hypothetical protein